MIEALDAHHHFWDPSKGDYSWMTDHHQPIRKVFAPQDLEPALAANGVNGTILVQTWSSLDETVAFLELATQTAFVLGVVGWVDLTSPDVGAQLDQLLAGVGGKYLVSIRHQVHDEPDANWLCRTDVRHGLAQVVKRGLSYDLLLRPREIPAALETVAAFPDLRFVIDHIAKPEIAQNGFVPWANAMAGFAAHRDHVWCKLSGMTTEAAWESSDDTQFTPYIDEVLNIFGPERCMYGSDWPVCNLAGGYRRSLSIVRDALRNLPLDQQTAILRGNAAQAYQLRHSAP
ncbi:amidohydrolase [Pseudoruegeria sp. SK021]|uniref:amidohydrolase family protein n=1 Tax=Pseudoruegeria sp. SK021 TaxID=1933035 RepID=UPI000A25D9FD|nr:amidohydrolase family protein [Pseudoruegeria sp. SK021]OSP55812.1 hypothetical protein BV911_05410 [Pseudoruegeria sp. SK021]